MDKELRYQLLRAAIRDRKFLKVCARDMVPALFTTKEEQIVAEAATKFYIKYEDPVGPLLRTDVAELAAAQKVGSDTQTRLKALIDHLQGTKMEMVGVDVLTDKLKALKRSSLYDAAVDEILAAKEEGKFNAELLSELFDRFRRELDTSDVVLHDYLGDVETRILRRKKHKSTRFPLLLIDDVDEKTDVIGRGHFAMLMAPPGGGKGLGLVKIGIAYAMQGLKVLHLTLEDPKELVEDRLDASLAGIKLKELKVLPKTLRRRFRKIKEAISGNYKIIDGTDSEWSVSRIERVLDMAKRKGYQFDAVVVDYDDELVCEKVFKGESSRRFEFSEIYRRLRKMAADYQILVWTAAQTTKAGMNTEVIWGQHIAEDFSKIRKVFFAMGVGSSKELPGLKNLSIIKNRLGGRAGFVIPIMSDWEQALFFDPEATRLLRRKKRVETKRKVDAKR